MGGAGFDPSQIRATEVRALLEEELPSQAEMCKSFTGEKPLFFESVRSRE